MELSYPEPKIYSALNNFVASINSENGHALTNKFEALIFPPPSIGGNSITSVSHGSALKSAGARGASMRVEAINLPGRNLDTTTDSNIYGPTREVVNGVSYAEDITVTFLSSGDLSERKFFEEWQNQAIDTRTWDIGYYNDYVGIIEIYLMDKNGKRLFGVKLHEAFPKTIGPTPLSNAQKNTLIKTEVSFAFRYWTPIDEIKRNLIEHSIGQGLPSGHAQIIGAHYENLMNLPATKRFLGF